MNKKIRLGILGGTFNPPHIGHIKSAENFIEQVKLDKLLIIPTFIPPHKDKNDDTTAEQRLQMCKIAFTHLKNVEVSDMEIRRKGKSYSYLTLEELQSENRELFFLMGTDMFLTLDEWKNPEIIFSLCNICYIRRETDCEKAEQIDDKKKLYQQKYNAKIIEVNGEAVEISSTELRQRIKSNEDCNKYLTENVIEFIEEERLYK